MPSLNKAILIGHLGKDPEIRYLQNGDPVASFSLATTEKWTKNGEKHEKTEWHRISVFGKPAQFVRDYLTKGAAVYVEGSIQYEEWNDKDGNKRSATKIKAHTVQALGKSERPEKAEAKEEFVAADDDVPF